MAVFPARIIATNPLPRGFLPSAKSAKALTYLYPAEDAQLLKAADVPFCYRLLYGFLAREGMRTSEAVGLRWGDIAWTDDGAAAVHSTRTRRMTPAPGRLLLGVAEALRLWRESGTEEDRAADEHVFRDEYGRPMSRDRLAETLREHLTAPRSSGSSSSSPARPAGQSEPMTSAPRSSRWPWPTGARRRGSWTAPGTSRAR